MSRPTFAELLAQQPELAARIERCTPDPRLALELPAPTVRTLVDPCSPSRAARDGHGRAGAAGEE